MKILLIGEPMGLFIANETGSLSTVGHFSASIAGAEYNVAVGLSRLGHEALFCTKLGFDPLGERIIRGMHENGISSTHVMRDERRLTGFMMKNKVEKGDPEIFYYRRHSAASSITTHEVDSLDLSDCGYVHITGIFPAISPSTLSAVNRLIARASKSNIPITFDPNLRPQLWESEAVMVRTLNALAAHADLILPGISEGKILTGKTEENEIAAYYHALGVSNVIVKLGAKGCFFSTSDGSSGYSPAFPASKKVDTVGAGDGFAAGVISALAEGESLAQAAFRGNVIGAIQITNKSDNEGLPTREQLEAVIKAGCA